MLLKKSIFICEQKHSTDRLKESPSRWFQLRREHAGLGREPLTPVELARYYISWNLLMRNKTLWNLVGERREEFEWVCCKALAGRGSIYNAAARPNARLLSRPKIPGSLCRFIQFINFFHLHAILVHRHSRLDQDGQGRWKQSLVTQVTLALPSSPLTIHFH
jgi:hypothetical protein